MSDSVRPHRRQPTRLPRPWDSPGKNTGVGCHFLLQCMIVKSESEGAQSCPTLSDPMDCSPPGSSVHGIFQAGALEWVPLRYAVTITPLQGGYVGDKSCYHCGSCHLPTGSGQKGEKYFPSGWRERVQWKDAQVIGRKTLTIVSEELQIHRK